VTFLEDLPSTDGLHQLPTSDGGIEIIATRYTKPSQALDACRANTISLMPPQYYLLTTLAELLDKPDGRARVEQLSASSFGQMLINPRALTEKDEQGRTILTYEGDETRGGPEGRLHRSHVRFAPGGVSLNHLNM
jgi:hypothetical protein